MVQDIKVGLSHKQVAMSMIGPVAAYLGAFWEENPGSCRQVPHSCMLRFCDMMSTKDNIFTNYFLNYVPVVLFETTA